MMLGPIANSCDLRFVRRFLKPIRFWEIGSKPSESTFPPDGLVNIAQCECDIFIPLPSFPFLLGGIGIIIETFFWYSR